MTFESIIEYAPSIILRKLEQLKFLRERPDYHPEESVYTHIKIVTERLIPTADKNLILSGILHDICKFDTVRKNERTGWPTSPGHDIAAKELIIKTPKISEWIDDFGAQSDIVAEICGAHMRIHQLPEMRETKRKDQIEEWKKIGIWEQLQIFGDADSMLKEFDLTAVKNKINEEGSNS